MRFISYLLLLFISTTFLSADTKRFALDKNLFTKSGIDEAPPANEKEAEDKREKAFLDNFSIGLLYNDYSKDIIEEATVRNGTVRITDSKDYTVALGLQAYYPLYKNGIIETTETNGKKSSKLISEYGIGPYVGLNIDSQNIIDSASIGLCYSHRREGSGFVIGVGYVFDPRVKRLADDFQNGSAAPTDGNGDTLPIAYKYESAGAFQIMLSFTPGIKNKE